MNLLKKMGFLYPALLVFSFNSFILAAETTSLKAPDFAAMARAKASLQSYLYGSPVLKGAMNRMLDDGSFQNDLLEISVREGLTNRFTSWLGSRKTSYYKLTRRTYGVDGNPVFLAKTEIFRGPIEVEATEKGLAIRFFSESPEGVTDFSAAKLRHTTIAYIHVPHERLYNNGKIDFALANLLYKNDNNEVVTRANADDVNGFFWAKADQLFANAASISVSDYRISLAREFAGYSALKAKNSAQAAKAAANSAYQMAEEMVKSSSAQSAYDLAMMTVHITAAWAEISVALAEAGTLNPMALAHAKMAYESSKNAFGYYHKFMGTNDDVAKGQLAYLSELEEIASQSYFSVDKLVKAGVKLGNLDPSALLDLASAASSAKKAIAKYANLPVGTTAPVAPAA